MIKECAAAAIASIAANSQLLVFLRTFAIALARPSSCLPPKKLEYTTGLNPNSDCTQSSRGSIFSSCLSTIYLTIIGIKRSKISLNLC